MLKKHQKMNKKILIFLIGIFIISFVSACHCGDGKVNQISEECDFGLLNGLECSADYDESCTYCSIDCQWVEIGGPYCGDSILQSFYEECDEGDLNGILCTAGYESFCEYCNENCILNILEGGYCGDEIVQSEYEECDGGQDCDDDCNLIEECDRENDYDCDDVPNKKDNCVYVYNPLQIDSDGDGKGDMCDPDPFGFCGDLVCQLQFGENCLICPTDCGSCDGEPFCGDWIVNGDEECDDGNNFNGDGCSADCKCEDCTDGECFCGDGIINDDEECDDGNNINGDGCSASCEIENIYVPNCGNNVLDSNEECDDGNAINGDGCSSICTLETNGAYCGDSVLGENEECDDGNNFNGDGCSSTCQIEPDFKPVCGNEIVEFNEECDDGDENGERCDNDDDDCTYCSSRCRLVELKEDKEDKDKEDYRTISYTRFCEPNWVCDGWGPCVNGTMIRECSDTNKCGVSANKPIEELWCELPTVKIGETQQTSNFPWIITLILALLVIGAITIVVNKV